MQEIENGRPRFGFLIGVSGWGLELGDFEHATFTTR